MKKITLKLLAAFGLVAGCFAQMSSQAQCCITIPSTNNVASVNIMTTPWGINFDFAQADNNATFVDQVIAPAAIPAGTYAGWCIDVVNGISDYSTVYSTTLYSSCDTNLNNELPTGYPSTCYVSPATWHEVNYILNHKGTNYFWDIQNAIWYFVGGPQPVGLTTPPYPPTNPSLVTAIINDALTNGPAWQSQCGDIVGVIVAITPAPNAALDQLTMIEVPCDSITFIKCPTNSVLGCNPKTIPDVQNPINTNCVAAVSCAGAAVTITGTSYTTSAGCQYTRLITYTATDAYSNSATCVQMVQWTIDTNAPTIILAPTNMNLGCNPTNLSTYTAAYIKSKVTASDSCGGSTTVTVTQGPDSGTPCSMSRTFTITVSDTCGNVTTPRYVTYTWSADTNAPVITYVPAGGYLGCNPTNLPSDASIKAMVKATDNCSVSSTNVSHSDITNGCTITRMFFVTATDACGNTTPYSTNNTVVYSWTLNKTAPVITCPPDITITNNVAPYCTYTPCDYGAVCNGSNAACILTNCFKKVYTNGCSWCGITNTGSHCIKFTDGNCLHTFENCVGNPGCLKSNYVNPAICEGGTFASHVACLKLNVDFGDCKAVTGFAGGCGDLILNDQTCPLNGWSVRQVLGLCHTALGGCDVSAYGCNVSNLTVICSNLNQSFENCHPSSWCCGHLVPPTVTNVPPSVTGTATATDTCGAKLPVTYTDVITAGACAGHYSIARTWVAVDGCGNSNYCTQIISVGSTVGSVCGYVFADCNGDGLLTPGIDAGVSNVVVTIKGSNGVVIGTITTDSTGAYCFYNLTPGNYTVSIVQPSNSVQTAGCHTNHWIDNTGRDCWNENDGNQHCKATGGYECWTANDGYCHSKNSSGQDCWTDNKGNYHTQSCNYTSCNVPKGNSETFCLGPCESKNGVNFAYQGISCTAVVCVNGPSKGVCGQWGTYTCCVTNTGNACFKSCTVSVCGGNYTCPPLSPGQGCSFPVNYQYQWGDCGNFSCKATATCNNYVSSNPCTAQGSCNTPVGWW
jgi:hypothetical protein